MVNFMFIKMKNMPKNILEGKMEKSKQIKNVSREEIKQFIFATTNITKNTFIAFERAGSMGMDRYNFYVGIMTGLHMMANEFCNEDFKDSFFTIDRGGAFSRCQENGMEKPS